MTLTLGFPPDQGPVGFPGDPGPPGEVGPRVSLTQGEGWVEGGLLWRHSVWRVGTGDVGGRRKNGKLGRFGGEVSQAWGSL